MLSLIKKLNHRAKVLQSSYGRIDVKEIVNTGMFNLERAQTGYGWLQDLHAMTLREVNGKKSVTPKPETEEYGVRNFVYTRRRPFHPLRLFQLLHDKFILQLEHPEEGEEEEGGEEEEVFSEDDAMDVDSDTLPQAQRSTSTSSDTAMSDSTTSNSTAPTSPSLTANAEDKDKSMMDAIAPSIPDNATILATKRAHPLFARLFRSKGEVSLATRPFRAGEWSQAGAMLTLSGGRPWFVTLPESEYITGDEEIDGLVRHDIAKGGEWGDRRQEVVFIGEELDIGGIERELDGCLLDDEEWEVWQGIMRGQGGQEEKLAMLAERFDDGFPDWPEEDEEEGHEGHGHGPGGHGKAKHLITKEGIVR